MSGRKGQIAPRNDTVVWIRGVVDDTDPEETDGSPKWIDNATVTWQLLDANGLTEPEDILVGGVQVSSGVGIPVGEGGVYLIELSHSLAVIAANDWYLHAVVTTPSGYKADLLRGFAGTTRTGVTDGT